ncbi:winged helix-turn-helix transcriptional regulator [Tenacibaculum sp. MEBiC06402]|uniref:winged helix-turn-helix transcriptional regulator n=1 Tax=unclassified Tenacibaculum TaxID=2635139 RepID=UPI003B992F07
MNMTKCPLTAALKVVGGKWKPIIILNLRKSSKRFGQLDFAIPGISRKVLTSHLSELVRDNLVIRDSYAETPPRVEYRLTKKAEELVPIFQELGKWGTYLIEMDLDE